MRDVKDAGSPSEWLVCFGEYKNSNQQATKRPSGIIDRTADFRIRPKWNKIPSLSFACSVRLREVTRPAAPPCHLHHEPLGKCPSWAFSLRSSARHSSWLPWSSDPMRLRLIDRSLGCSHPHLLFSFHHSCSPFIFFLGFELRNWRIKGLTNSHQVLQLISIDIHISIRFSPLSKNQYHLSVSEKKSPK